MEVLVVSKVDNEQHATFTLQNSPAVELPSSSIRVHTLLVSLTSNNLSYARGGHSLHWFVYLILHNCGLLTFNKLGGTHIPCRPCLQLRTMTPNLGALCQRGVTL